MKKLLLTLTAFLVLTVSFGAFNLTEPTKKASEVFIPIGKSGYKISLMDLSQIKVKEFETASGKKMNLANKIAFKVAQKELRHAINHDGTLNSKKLNKLANKMVDAPSGFNIGGFALGFLLGIIGVLIAYVISDDKKAARTKWAWIGFALAVVIYLLVLLA